MHLSTRARLAVVIVMIAALAALVTMAGIRDGAVLDAAAATTVAAAKPKAATGPTVAQITAERARAWACQDALGVKRTKSGKITAAAGAAYRRWQFNLWRTRADAYCHVLRTARNDIEVAAVIAFGDYAGQALRVAECESGWSPGASNGQYQGAWQMGSSERDLFGHGPDFLSQAFAANRYFVASGRDWSPWSCRP